MAPLVPELSALPVSGTFDGELVAFGDDGSPDFPLLCARMLMRRSGIVVTYVVFDLLSLNGLDLTGAPYSQRRARLEALNVNGVFWQTPETFEDGHALFEAVLRTRARGRRCETPEQSLPAQASAAG
jgi:bifunctional non-homologous end joining protein LigD